MGNIMKSLNQITFYSYKPKFKIDKPIRLIELFGGISCQAQALLNLGVDFENYRYCDFDKYACQSHNEIMGTNDKPSDITKWKGEDLGVCDTDKYCYIMTTHFLARICPLLAKWLVWKGVVEQEVDCFGKLKDF